MLPKLKEEMNKLHNMASEDIQPKTCENYIDLIIDLYIYVYGKKMYASDPYSYNASSAPNFLINAYLSCRQFVWQIFEAE